MSDLRPLICFSGGLDSTTMLWMTPAADMLRVHVTNAREKNDREDEACERIRALVLQHKRKRGEDHPEGRMFIAQYIIEGTGELGFSQMPVWFIKLFEMTNPKRHSCASVGYCDGDSGTGSIPHLVQAWESLWKAARPCTPFVPLTFPLQYISKYAMLQSLPEDVVKATWSCEAISETVIGECGQCVPCQRKFFEYLKAGKQHLLEEKMFTACSKKFVTTDVIQRLADAVHSPYKSPHYFPMVNGVTGEVEHITS